MKRCLALILFCALLSGCLSGQTATTAMPEASGRELPEIVRPDKDGKEHSLHALMGAKGTVVLFFADDCPCSNVYQHRLKAIFGEFYPQGIRAIGINEREVIKVDQHPGFEDPALWPSLSMAHLYDPGYLAARKFHARITPEVFVADAEGVIRYHGRIDNNQEEEQVTVHNLRNALLRVVAGQRPEPAETKPWGCFIPQ